MGSNTGYAGKVNIVPRVSGNTTTQITTGTINRASVSEQDLKDDLNYSNRTGNGGPARDPWLTYAYESAKANPISSEAGSPQGAKSLFNEYAIVVHPRTSDPNDFFDIEGNGGIWPKYEEPTGTGTGKGGRVLLAQHLVEHSPPHGIVDLDGLPISSTPYYASDFIFAKYFKKIPLNHLVTLRRFPFPCYDNLEFDAGRVFKPIAQAVTYFGDPTENPLKSLTKFSGFINWKEMEADVNDIEGEERGLDETPFFDKLQGANAGRVKGSSLTGAAKYGNSFANQGRGKSASDALDQQERAKLAADPNYTNEILGPVNVVNKALIRDRGLGATQQISLTFEYELRSIAGINPRMAMLDLLCNMLALCFNNAKFWGGANRYFPRINQSSFIGDQDAFYRGDYKTYMKSFVSQIGDSLGSGLSMLKGVIGGILSGDFSQLGGALGNAAGGIFELERFKSRPKIIGFKALLTGLPVGEWHLTVGNPYRPIAMIGNLVVDSFDMELDGPLGADDFPSNLKFVINLKQGRARDKGDVESVFNLGQGRVYYPPYGLNTDPANSSAATGTRVQTSNQGKSSKTERVANPPIKTNKNIGRGQGSAGDIDFVKKLNGTVF